MEPLGLWDYVREPWRLLKLPAAFLAVLLLAAISLAILFVGEWLGGILR